MDENDMCFEIPWVFLGHNVASVPINTTCWDDLIDGVKHDSKLGGLGREEEIRLKVMGFTKEDERVLGCLDHIGICAV